jgi:hypothetical protein
MTQQACCLGRQPLPIVDGAGTQVSHHRLFRHPVDLDMVGLLDAGSGIEDGVRPAAVIAQEQQAFARLVEPADRSDEGQVDAVEAGIDRGAPLWVVPRRQHAARLVEHQIDALLGADRLAVDGDAGAADLQAQGRIAGEPPVDTDAALGDQLLGLAARAIAELGQDAREADGRWARAGMSGHDGFRTAARAAGANGRRTRSERRRAKAKPCAPVDRIWIGPVAMLRVARIVAGPAPLSPSGAVAGSGLDARDDSAPGTPGTLEDAALASHGR